jgi:dGTPase
VSKGRVGRRQAAAPGLARYAASDATSRGRLHAEPRHPFRGEYQRDRDRVIHSGAFRRLVYKTQVFINHEGDLYRTRLTHSLEVAQIGRTVARRLQLNEDLVEAIALAHDLGHTPFGHAGEAALNECLREWGGFEHNLQTLRVVDELEDRYGAFPGLNLSFEAREGILKHCSKRNARWLGAIGARFLLRQQPTLEAQVANLADEIAYNNHDIDDGLRSSLLTEQDLRDVTLFQRHLAVTEQRYPGAIARARIQETIRGMINEVVTDLIETSAAAIRKAVPRHPDDVRQHGRPLIGLSSHIAAEHLALKRVLRKRLYQHPRVLRITGRAQRMLKALFKAFMEDPRRMPRDHARRARQLDQLAGPAGRARAVADYIAGMTDRFALAAYQRLIDPTAELR